MRKGPPVSVGDALGPWVDPGFNSGLIQRCKGGWNTPVHELTNELLATYLRQKISVALLLPEAQRRLSEKYVDGTELYEGELENALKFATGAP